MLQKLEFMQNLTEMRLTSLRNGNSNMTLEEINAEITAARVERRNEPGNCPRRMINMTF
jgi:hypothetical protein